MGKISEYKIQIITLIFCLIYFLYSIVITFSDVMGLKYESWKQAENKSTVYSSRRSTTVTYNFVKDGVRISRKYPGILEGINTWMWGIDKQAPKQDISFYLRRKDEQKIENGQIKHRNDIFGNTLNEIQAVPFFGLRKINKVPDKTLLILDVWKYNYSILLAFILFILPYIIIFILGKIFKIKIEKNNDKRTSGKIGGYMIVCFIVLVINLLV